MFKVKATPKGIPRAFHRCKVIGTETGEEDIRVKLGVGKFEISKTFPVELDPESPEADELRVLMGNGELPDEADDLVGKEALVFVTSRRGAGGRFLPTPGVLISEQELRDSIKKLEDEEDEEETPVKPTPPTKTSSKK